MGQSGKWIGRASPNSALTVVARRSIRERMKTLWDCAPLAAKRSDEDIEYVHQLRVSTRRARAALQVYGGLLPKQKVQRMKGMLRDLRRQRLIVWLLLVCSSVLLVGCSSSDSTSADGASGIKLEGSGASFPDPLYQRWFEEYSRATDGVTVEYAATGSGMGITDLTNGLVDFAGSDAAMSDEEMAKVDAGVQLLPVTAGTIVLAYNLADGPAELKLSRAAYTGIFLGKVTKWNDPAIIASNDGVSMPDKDIYVITRADSSGTTYVFSQHLAAIHPDFAKQPGPGKTVDWPISKMTRALRNAGMTEQIGRIDGSVGYVEYGFALHGELAMACLENKQGKYITPTLESGAAALGNVEEMPEDLRVWVTDPDGADSYPIVTYTWLMCYKTYDSPEKAEAMRNVIKYCLTEGQACSGEMGYIPLPENVVALVTEAIDNIQ